MKKFENLGKILSKEELRKIKGGEEEDPNGCIADGSPCRLFKDCCHVCKATFKCGPSPT